MKTRVITAVVALIIFVPLLVIGGMPLLILTLAMAVVAMSEILRMKHRFFVFGSIAELCWCYCNYTTEINLARYAI